MECPAPDDDNEAGRFDVPGQVREREEDDRVFVRTLKLDGLEIAREHLAWSVVPGALLLDDQHARPGQVDDQAAAEHRSVGNGIVTYYITIRYKRICKR